MSSKYGSHSFSKTVHAFIIAVSAMVCFFLIQFFSTHAFSRINIEGVFPESGTLKIYYAKKTHDFASGMDVEIAIEGSKQAQIIQIPLNNRIAHKLRFDLSSLSKPGQATSNPTIIERITLDSFFLAKQTTIDLSKLHVSPTEQNVKLKFSGNDLIVSANDAVFETTQINVEKHVFLHYVLPLFLALILWLFITTVEWRAFPAIEDLFNNQQSRNVNNLRSLDGLRGVAALSVLLEHTMAPFIGLGRAGVWLFFTLSGFLLVRSFILYPDKMKTLDGLKNYFLKRIKRVLPMFYFMITVIFLLRGKVDSAIRHYLLIQGDGHFWTILHELYFYIILPLVACSAYLLFKRKYLWVILLLIILALTWYYFASPDVLSIYGLGRRHTPYFYVFLLGMAAGYFYYGVYLYSESIQRYCMAVNKLLSLIALMTMAVCFFYASNLGIINEHISVWSFEFTSAVIATILVLLSAITSEKGIYNRILSLSLLRLVGIVGYSFYLIHPYAIAIFTNTFEFVFAVSPAEVLPGVVSLIGSFLITLPIAMFTYSYIERPFLKK